MKTNKLLIIFLFLSFFSSCNQIDQKITNAENFIESKTSNIDNYDKNELDELDEIFVSLENDLKMNRDNYTQEQIRKTNFLIGRYKGLKVKYQLKVFKNSMDDFKDQLKGSLNSIEDSINSN
jgi:hypothetical protein